ncbi:MAG: aminotransferase class IV, partial [Candidatus Calescibacterium sp.]|nr:aminotransferase class IV [Candidatus Calescibacterium sp.]MDW8133162.1 aminotransferase class IV [Candidatus Calescibacterium sp.]
IEANNANAQEAIMLNQNGYITECTADNIFIVHNGKVKTPPAYVGILEGITRESVLQMCKELNIESEEVIIDVKDLLTAEEVFITGTGAEIVPIRQINNIQFNIGKTTQKLIEYFPEFVKKNSTPVFVKV